ncbi:MAG: redoxin domain-containing protein [Akkermansia sp.]|nr:redoxin domain-containing protein [Akkermansia sp.]
MKKILSLLVAALAAWAPLFADNDELQQKQKNIAKLRAALKSMNYLTKCEPDAARFYMYLSAASWNKSSTSVLPKILAEYEKIKKAGGEVIMVNYDRTERAARKFIDDFGIDIPIFRTTKKKDDDLGLPGFEPAESLPAVTMVDNEGSILYRGHAATYIIWPTIITNSGCAASTTGCGGQIATGDAVYQALCRVKYVSKAKPRKGASFYIMLCASQLYEECDAAMPAIIKEYDAIQKAGGELVLICVTGDEPVTKAYMEKYKMPFPVAAHTYKNICGANIPNYSVAMTVPEFTTLSSGGTILGTEHGANIGYWRNHTASLP